MLALHLVQPSIRWWSVMRCHALHSILQVDPTGVPTAQPMSKTRPPQLANIALHCGHRSTFSHCKLGLRARLDGSTYRNFDKTTIESKNKETMTVKDKKVNLHFWHPTSRSNSATRCGKRRAWTGASLVFIDALSQHVSQFHSTNFLERSWQTDTLCITLLYIVDAQWYTCLVTLSWSVTVCHGLFMSSSFGSH